MKILIIGAGNVGNALAADLCSRSFEVALWADPRHLGNSLDIEARGLESKGEIVGHYWPSVEKDLGGAIRASEIIIVTVPSRDTAREDLVAALRRLDLTKKILIWIPGNLIGLMEPQQLNTFATFETVTSPYGCRLDDEGRIFVKSIKHMIEIASDRDDLGPHTRSQLDNIFRGRLDWRASSMEIALNSVACILHSPSVIMNAGRIEDSKGDFYFYRQGMTESVIKMARKLDQARLMMVGRFNFQKLSCLDLLNRWYGKSHSELGSFVRDSESHNSTKGAPTNMRHRYLAEDARLLIFFRDLAYKLGVDAKPFVWATYAMEVLMGENLEEIGFTISKAGMQDLSEEDIIDKWGCKI